MGFDSFSLGNIDFSGLSGLGGGSSGIDLRTLRRRGRKVLGQILEPSDREAFGQAQRQFEGAVQTTKEGFRNARANVGEAFRGASRSAIEQGQQAYGQALQGLTQGGLAGTSSIAANLRAGIGYGTSRAIQDIQDRIGQIMSQLSAQEGQAVAGAQQNLGSFLFSRGLSDRDRNMLHFQLLTAGGLQPYSGLERSIQAFGSAAEAVSNFIPTPSGGG